MGQATNNAIAMMSTNAERHRQGLEANRYAQQQDALAKADRDRTFNQNAMNQNRIADQDKARLAREQAKHTWDQVLKAQDAKQAVEFAMMGQRDAIQYGLMDPKDALPDEVIVQRVGAVWRPPQATYGSTQSGIGPDGNPTFARLNQNTGQMESTPGVTPIPTKASGPPPSKKITYKNGDTQEMEWDGTKYNPIGDRVPRQVKGAKDPNAPASFDDEMKLRKEFDGLTKEFRLQETAMARILASTEEPSAAGDLALIFNYMKLLDPGSTVREGEFATAQDSAGVPQRVVAKYNSLFSGERLSEPQRADFKDRAGKLYKSAAEGYSVTQARYKELAESYKANPDRIGVSPPRFSEKDYALSEEETAAARLERLKNGG